MDSFTQAAIKFPFAFSHGSSKDNYELVAFFRGRSLAPKRYIEHLFFRLRILHIEVYEA